MAQDLHGPQQLDYAGEPLRVGELRDPVLKPAIRAFTISECATGTYHVTCWNEDRSSCGVATYYDPGFSPWTDPMLLSDNVSALERSGHVNMTGKDFDYRIGQWVQS